MFRNCDRKYFKIIWKILCQRQHCFSYFFQIDITISSHLCFIVRYVESSVLSIQIFFFFIRAGTKVPASFQLWPFYNPSLYKKKRREQFSHAFLCMSVISDFHWSPSRYCCFQIQVSTVLRLQVCISEWVLPFPQ